MADATIRLEATSEQLRTYLTWMFGRSDVTERASPPDLRFVAGEPLRSDRQVEARASSVVRVWQQEHITWCQHRSGQLARVENGRLALGPAPIGDHDEGWQSTRQLAAEALAAWFGRRHRSLVHAALVSTGERSLIVLGPTGSGKSTVVASGLVAGWAAHADDLVVVRSDGSSLDAWGVPKVPAFDSAAIDALGIASTPSVGDRRGRSTVSQDVFTDGRTHPFAVVELAHGDGPTRIEQLDHDVMVPIITRSIFECHHAGRLAAHIATIARLAALPAFRLAIGIDPRRRMAEVATALDDIVTQAT